MLSAYSVRGGVLDRQTIGSDDPVPDEAVWFDLITPTVSEDKQVERHLGVAVPTREEMQEIELSSRLYIENGARYMTATLMCHSDTDTPKATPVTFILAGHRLVTVRYDEPRPFVLVDHKLAKSCSPQITGESVLMELLDAVIDRAADILERVSAQVDVVSRQIFEPDDSSAFERARTYRAVLKTIGKRGDLASKVRESLTTVGRVVLFLANEADGLRWPKEMRAQLKSMQRDIGSIADFASFLTNKIQFLLDATLGMVGLEQNNIIKIFSVVAVVLMPPTLVASVYGMNFKHMPELDWTFGYPYALVLMIIAAILPYLFFKWRKWL